MLIAVPKNRPPTAPGEIIQEEFLVPLGTSQAELARRMGVPLAVTLEGPLCGDSRDADTKENRWTVGVGCSGCSAQIVARSAGCVVKEGECNEALAVAEELATVVGNKLASARFGASG